VIYNMEVTKLEILALGVVGVLALVMCPVVLVNKLERVLVFALWV
jgi:hypothetical protein